jgi:DnaK suppressor protein
MPLTDEQLQEFKEALDQRLEELLGHADATVTDMTDEKHNFPDPTDRASVESDRNFVLRLRDRERKLIGKIRAALERIEEGTFGECEECGNDIGYKRLEARPVTTLCIECKTKQEAGEKARGE